MRAKHLLIIAAVIIAAITQLQAQPAVETINVDTLAYLGKGVAGEAGGAFFLPDGNIIALWKDTPLIIDSKSGEILRTLESCNSESVGRAKVSKDGKRFIATKMGPELVIWDVETGKILTNSGNIHGYCFSPDGTKLYISGGNPNNYGAIRVVDMNTLEEIERFGKFSSGFLIDISPDGQTIVAYVTKEHNQSDPITSQIVQINLNDKKNYTVVETMEPGIKSLQFSPDGKQIALLYDNGNYIYIYIYDLETKEKKYIRSEELSILFGFDIAVMGNPFYLDGNTILFSIIDFPFKKYYFLDWNISENMVKNYIGFNTNRSIDIKDSIALLCSQGGLLGFLNKNFVSVKDNIPTNESILTYNNNQLEFNSDIAFIAESTIYDTTGKQIANLGTEAFLVGRNTIQVNQPLPIGVYLLTIKNDTNQFSYKFIVE
ncbi:MAG: T9SS type A sorting domain-containing protein [bacterium]